MNTNPKAKILISLFISFLKIGAFTFGGGYAMIPLIQKEICQKHKWLTDDDIFDIVTISESTPGPIAINTATFVGYRSAGVLGAFIATLGIVLPSFIIILIVSTVLREFQEIKAVRYAFFGIRAGVLALIIKTLWSMLKKCPKNAFSYIISACVFLVTAFFNINVLAVLVICAILGLVYSALQTRREK